MVPSSSPEQWGKGREHREGKSANRMIMSLPLTDSHGKLQLDFSDQNAGENSTECLKEIYSTPNTWLIFTQKSQGVCACPVWELFVFTKVGNHAQPHLPRVLRCSIRSEHPQELMNFPCAPSPVPGSVCVSQWSCWEIPHFI